MANENYGFTLGKAKEANIVKNLVTNLMGGKVSAGSLEAMLGGESLGAIDSRVSDHLKNMSFRQKELGDLSVLSTAENDFVTRIGEMRKIAVGSVAGMEAFSQPMTQTETVRARAATIDINSRSAQQFPAAEALFPTVTVGHKQDGLVIPIDVPGVGNYNVSGNGHEAFEQMRPISSILADSSFDSGDDLKMYPVCPTNANDANAQFFVPSALWAPWDVQYNDNDLLGRQAHKTNFLKVGRIPNLLNLSRAPGAPLMDGSDEIEPSSVRVKRVLIKLKTKESADPVAVVLDTSSFANAAMRQSNVANSVEKYEVSMPIIISTNSLKLKDKTTNVAFKTLTDASLTPYVSFEVKLSYQRGTRTMSITTQPLQLESVEGESGQRMINGATATPPSVQQLMTAQAVEGTVEGLELAYNHSNTNHSRYGVTCVYASRNASFPVFKRQVVSVKYPTEEDDTNTEILNKLTGMMSTLIRRNMSHDAFHAAEKHFNTLLENNGRQVLNVNDESSAIMPGQYFLRTTAIDSKINLLKEVSTLESKNTLENIQAVLVNKIIDIINALRVNSNIAAFREQDAMEEEYTIVAHAAMAPFLMVAGDFRTFGNKIKFKIVETNIDSQKGTMWVVPSSKTKETDIDIFGGMGICVTREMVVIEGMVAQANTRYRTLVTQPSYAHHGLCPANGRLLIEDINALLSDEGLIAKINKLQVNVSGSTGAVKEVAVDIPGAK